MDWTKEKAKEYLDKVIDDGETKESPKFVVTQVEFENEDEATTYYGLCAIIEAITREFAKMIPDDRREDFFNLLKESDFEILRALEINENFESDFITTADVRMQKVLRLGNELVVATEMCATFHQTILQYPTHGFFKCDTKIDFEKVTPALNFSLKMAYAEILRLIQVTSEAGNPPLLEILSRWSKTLLESEYFERVLQNYINNPGLIIELPSVAEANAVRAIVKDLKHPIEMPLLTAALNAFDRITSVFPPNENLDGEEVVNILNFAWYED